jgi:CRP-like cAMP-binding protein
MQNFGPEGYFAHKANSTRQTRLARHPLGDLDSLALVLHHQRGEIICSETRGGDYLYRLISGAALRLRARPGARRQALDMMIPGDYFGFQFADDEGIAVEAAEEDTTVFVYPRWCVSFLTDVDPEAGCALRQLELVAIARTRVHLFCRRRLSAAAKVSAFLIEMGDRMALSATGWFELPAPLDAVADYLDLSASTLKCCLFVLAQRGSIARAGGRCVRIDDRLALENEGSGPASDNIQMHAPNVNVQPNRTYSRGSDPLPATRITDFSRVH